MSHFIGKIDLLSLIGVKMADVDYDGVTEKCIVIPIKDNGIVMWKGELQLWFRAFAYRRPKNRFSHFIMKFIPKDSIKKLSASQLEVFANHSIGGMIKTDFNGEGSHMNETDTDPEEDFISKNI